MATNTSRNHGTPRDATRHPASPVPRKPRRAAFDKEYATLWLLTLTLGLGLGAVVRIAQRPQTASTAGQGSQLAALRSGAPGYGTPNSPIPYQNQHVLVLPQRSYGSRGVTRMS